MAPRRKNNDEPSPILTGRKSSDLKAISKADYDALSAAVVGAILEGSAVYVSPSRYGSVLVKYYVDGEKYAEAFDPGSNWTDIAEEILEALYNKEAVARVRRLRDVPIDERPSEGRRRAGPTSE